MTERVAPPDKPIEARLPYPPSNTVGSGLTPHALVGADHTASGLTIGHYLRATGASSFGFAAIQDADLPGTITRDSEVPGLVPDATTSAKGKVELATDGENAANVVVQGNDSRLSNSRTPTAHQLDGALHTVSGLTAGHALRATGASTFAFGAIQDADLPSSIARDSELPTQFYDRIQDEGSNLAQRKTLDFVGAGVSVADDAGNAKTIVTIAGGGAGSDPYTEITKSADQDVTNNLTRQNDTELIVPVTNGDLVHILAFIIYSGNNSTGDYKWAFTLPANCVAQGTHHNWSTADAYGSESPAATAIGGGALWPNAEVQSGTDAAHTTRLLTMDFTVLAKATGNIVFTFANASAAAGRTSRTHAGSTLRYRKMN